MFKNEDHNHPTEIEAVRRRCYLPRRCDPRPAVRPAPTFYQAMRVTGAGDPTVPLSETLEHKAAAAQAVPDRCCGLLLLRQPDRPCDRPRTRDLPPPGLCRKAHGDRRCCRCGSRWRTSSARYPSRATSSSCSAARPAVTAAAALPAPPKKHTRSRRTCGAEVQKGQSA